jgi:hypothetical protein
LSGFGGIIPDALSLYREGSLAPKPTQSDATLAALAGREQLAGKLENEFLPTVQDVFGSFGDRQKSIAEFATEGLQRQLQRNTLPKIGEGALQAGQFGSSRQGIAEGLATAEANRDIAETRANILQQGAQAQLAYAPQMMQLLGIPSQLLGEVGAARDTFNEQQTTLDFQNLLRLSQLIQGFIPGSNQTVIETAPKTSPLSTIAGLGLAIGGMGVSGGGTLLGNFLGGK